MIKSLSILFVLFLMSCNHKNKVEPIEKKLTQAEVMLQMNASILSHLNNESERIILLSETIKIPYDSLLQILKIYTLETQDHEYPRDSFKIFCERGLYEISKKFSYPKSKVASWIFSFKYGMLSKEEIEEDAVLNYEESKIDDTESQVSDDPLH